MAYSIIAQNNSTTTLADENGNVITVPSRSILDAGTTFTLVKINNNTATLEDSNGKIYRDIPCCIDLTQVTGFNVTKINNNKATLEDGDGNVFAGVPCVVNLTGTGGGSAVIEELNVTPSTSAQTITASGGTDGYSPVNVSAVDASIDANITAGNIKDGVTILGVTGNVVELNGETKTVTPQVYGQTLYPTAPKNGITEITVNAVTHNIDANIQAGNIKKDVSILGVTGTYEGTTPTGTKSITSNGVHDVAGYANADVQVPTTAPAKYVEKTVDVSGTLHSGGSSVINLSGVYNIDQYALCGAYYENTTISGAVDMSDLCTGGWTYGLTQTYACAYMFYNCTEITSVDMRNVDVIGGSHWADHMFFGCEKLTSANLSNLRVIGGDHGMGNECDYMFASSGLTSIDLSNLETTRRLYGDSAQYMFYSCEDLVSADLRKLKEPSSHMFDGCISLTNVNISSLQHPATYLFANCSSLTSLDMSNATNAGTSSYCCSGCSSLTNVDISSMYRIGTKAMQNFFKDCVALTSVSFPSAHSFGSRSDNFTNMCYGIPNITLHFPSNTQTKVSSMSTYSTTAPFGASAGTVLFDLPAIVTLTGADTNLYSRNPKYDTGTALAWKAGDYVDDVLDWTPYYTSGTTDPVVGDTIYSDAACTTAVTTISSIA